jgi:hypothetical protein
MVGSDVRLLRLNGLPITKYSVFVRLRLNLLANSHSLILIKSQLILDSICCIDLPEAVRVVSSANILILEFSTQFGKSFT